MASALSMGVTADVSVGTTCELLTGTRYCAVLTLVESDVAVYVVPNVADGASVPAAADRYAAAKMPLELDITAWGSVAVAADGPGTLTLRVQ